mgnify:CR=1 FL=1
MNAREARQEARKAEADKRGRGRKSKKAAKRSKRRKEKEAEEQRKKELSVQPGVAVGTTEASDEKIVYLTFDDGPSENTQKVLDILDQYDAKATFFYYGAETGVPSDDEKKHMMQGIRSVCTVSVMIMRSYILQKKRT